MHRALDWPRHFGNGTLAHKPVTLRRRPGLLAGLAVLPLILSCGLSIGDGPGCRLDGPPVALPEILDETSGLAVGIRDPSRIWTHNDAGHEPHLYALDAAGALHATVVVDQRNRDWENMDRGRCGPGSCLYLADTGDNLEVHTRVVLYRVPEPDGRVDGTASADRYLMRLPDGPRDVEAMYVLPDERIFFVTKGRNHPITLYRYPPPLRPDAVVTLEPVQVMSSGPAAPSRYVTGASATLDGATVVIRTYETLEFFTVTENDELHPLEDGRVNLRTLREPQGEAVAFLPDGRLILSSESGFTSLPSIVLLTCELG